MVTSRSLQGHYYYYTTTTEVLQTTSLRLCWSWHAKALQATASEGFAQGLFVAARMGFKPANLRPFGRKAPNLPLGHRARIGIYCTISCRRRYRGRHFIIIFYDNLGVNRFSSRLLGLNPRMRIWRNQSDPPVANIRQSWVDCWIDSGPKLVTAIETYSEKPARIGSLYRSAGPHFWLIIVPHQTTWPQRDRGRETETERFSCGYCAGGLSGSLSPHSVWRWTISDVCVTWRWLTYCVSFPGSV